MVSAVIFGVLELVTSKVIRRSSMYRKRSDGTLRPFGGVNVLLFGDMWQLKPVLGTALFANPAEESTEVGGHGLELLWGAPGTGVRKCWNLDHSLRCKDLWS